MGVVIPKEGRKIPKQVKMINLDCIINSADRLKPCEEDEGPAKTINASLERSKSGELYCVLI